MSERLTNACRFGVCSLCPDPGTCEHACHARPRVMAPVNQPAADRPNEAVA